MSTLILNIETTTKNCSVSITESGKMLCLKEINDGNYSHAENLHPFIEDVIRDSKKELNDLSAIAVSKGPGSYTGLRIGVSAAKGLCFALEIPLLSIDTLQSLAHSISIDRGIIIPLLDARRMEVYQAVYTADYQIIETTKAQIIDSMTFKKYLDIQKVHFMGDAVPKCKKIIKHPHAIFLDNYFPSAREMSALSYKKFIEKDFEDVAYFEPYYLKDFIGVKMKKL